MSAYVVIGTAPTVDTSIVVGPYMSTRTAAAAAESLTARGYVTEVAACLRVDDVEAIDWST